MAAGGGGGVGGGSSAQGSSAATQGATQAAELVRVLQSMIDVSAERLEGLRTHCATSAELTQNEIRILEEKLIKLFSDQLVTKSKFKDDEIPSELRNIPSLYQWLQVVGLSSESIKLVCLKICSIESLQDKSEKEIKTLLGNTREEEVRRLCCAISNLKKFTEILIKNGGNIGEVEVEIPLYWDSWDRHNLLKGSPRARHARASVPSEDALLPLPNGTPSRAIEFSSTPPTKRKNQTGLPLPTLLNDGPLLTKSKSHESQLGIKLDGEINGSEPNHHNHNTQIPSQGRIQLITETGTPNSPHVPICSPTRSPPYVVQHNQQSDTDDSFKSCNLTVPRSPRTPVSRGMCHYIAHRFTKTFKMIATCDYCDKQMFLGPGLRCKECKYKCHRDCASKVPPSCGLPPELIDEFRKKILAEKPDGFVFNSPFSGRSPQHNPASILTTLKIRKKSHPYQLNANVPSFPCGPDSSSNTSSCNSSTPSSPALVSNGTLPQTPHTPRTPHSSVTITSHNVPPPGPMLTNNRQQFNFPDVKKWAISDNKNGEGSSSGTGPGDSERTISHSGSASEDSERTPGRTDSLDGDPLQRNESAKWPRQNSLSMKEWDIPFTELRVDKLAVKLGIGRFFTVYKGNWHGDVAVKALNDHNLNDPGALESFKHEVAIFRKTRHENLVLFMGACMQHPNFAIVTSLCKGNTLYTHIHLRKDKFNMYKTTIIAQQISQGMGYLHARGIVHKDLKSKNIFLENGKVVITDFGLLGVAKLCDSNRTGDSLLIPPGWLCYLAPELLRKLKPRQTLHADDLPFTKESDVYAFGTVWYELLCGEWPFKGLPPEAVIWQVGKGIKQTLANLQASRDVKDILMLCWSYKVEERPDFAVLLNTLEKFPRKRLARSPSHPVHLSRSAESVF